MLNIKYFFTNSWPLTAYFSVLIYFFIPEDSYHFYNMLFENQITTKMAESLVLLMEHK